MKGFKFDNRFEVKITSIALSIFTIFAIMSGYLGKFIQIPKSWEIPIILAALLMITRMLSTLYHVDENIKKILEKEGVINIKRYDAYGEFYHDLGIALGNAKHSLDLTHIRNDPPEQFVLGKSYFDSIEKWCAKNPGAPVRRITATNNSLMLDWAKELYETTKRCPNFHVRICDWRSKYPMINMAIIDGKTVFLAITADIAERTAGLKINDPSMAKYFSDYYDNVWAHSTDVEDHLS